MASVVLSEACKTYPGGFEAVRRLTLDIADGEFLVLVGPSGCGKSTTLRLVAGLEDLTSGEIRIGDRVVNNVPPKDRDIAMVFQNYALYPHMTVYQNMAFALKLRRTPREQIDRRVREAARMLAIEDLLGRRPRMLSGGQRQRVAVGRAIVREPRAFLFDEPLSNLDASLRVSTRAELKTLHQRLRTTTLYVTHDQEEAMTLGDRIAVMASGTLQQVGPPLEVYRRPANRFVASFVGTPPMNFAEGRVSREGGRSVFRPNGSAGAWALPPSCSAAPEGPATLGFRPQALRDQAGGDATEGDAAISLDVDVQVVEPLGDVIDVVGRLSLGGPGAPAPRVVARIPARSDVTPGSVRRFRLDASQAHLIAPGEFGARLNADDHGSGA